MHRILNPKHWVYILCHVVMLMGGFLICFKAKSESLQFAVGSGVIGAGVCGLMVFVYVLVSEQTSDRLNVLSEFGILNVFDARSVRIKEEYVKRLANAKDSIEIIGFGLSAFREDFLGEFAKWKSHVNVRILLLDPEFPGVFDNYGKQRDVEEGGNSGRIASDVRSFLKSAAAFIGTGNGHSFNIRLYRCLPSINILRIDDELFWGPYLIGEQSRNSPTFLVKRGGLLFDRFSKQFKQIWSNEKFSRIPPSEWTRLES